MTVNFIRRVPFRGMVRVAVTAMTLFATNVLAQDISINLGQGGGGVTHKHQRNTVAG